MNCILIEYGENFAVVMNKRNEGKLVQKSNNIYSFEDILLLENKIIALKKKLRSYKDKLEVLELNSYTENMIENIFFCILGSIVAVDKIKILEKIILCFLILGIGQAISWNECGKQKERTFRIGELIVLMKNLESIISKLEKELFEMKFQTNYCVVSNSLQNAVGRYGFNHGLQNRENYDFSDLQYMSNVHVRKLVP